MKFNLQNIFLLLMLCISAIRIGYYFGEKDGRGKTRILAQFEDIDLVVTNDIREYSGRFKTIDGEIFYEFDVTKNGYRVRGWCNQIPKQEDSK